MKVLQKVNMDSLPVRRGYVRSARYLHCEESDIKVGSMKEEPVQQRGLLQISAAQTDSLDMRDSRFSPISSNQTGHIQQ